MRLFVTEKPDVGRELARYLSAKFGGELNRSAMSIKVGKDVVTWAMGHMLAQMPPDYYLPKTLPRNQKGVVPWKSAPLPIIPKPFVYEPPAGDDKRKAAQLNEIGRLMKAADEIYNASDRDREGQLIFDEILDYFKITKKPVRRLMFSALDTKSFDHAFENVADNFAPAIKNIGLAAMARGQADWLIGMNGTRAVTLSHKAGDVGVMSVGRVMTPTMSIVVRRHKEIASFRSKTFWTPVVDLGDGAVLTWSKSLADEGNPAIDGDGRIIDRSFAQAIVDEIERGLKGTITDSKSVEREKEPPLPFSLPSIQSELSKRYGLSVNEVTKACQSLYEKKMQTYVGTDCRYLPESMHGEARQVLTGLGGAVSGLSAPIRGADVSIKYGCWDDGKVTGEGAAAHHAIIPTGNKGVIESEAEKLVYEAVCRRYVAQFHQPYRYLSLSLVAQFGKNEFKATASMPLSMGWRDVENDTEDASDKSGDSPAAKPSDKNNRNT